MRSLIASNLVSLDGRIAGPGGDLSRMPFDDSFSQRNAELLRSADLILAGRRTYEGLAAYWPPIADDVSQPPDEREISRLNGALTKVVVSDTLDEGIGAWRDTTEVVRIADAHTRLTQLKSEGDGDIVMFGSAILLHDLLQAGLVDEVHLMVGPGVVGDGLPLFDQPIPGQLTLVEVRQLEGSPNVLLRYRISGPLVEELP